ncbi:transaldolase [Maribacter sp. X9]|uniref:transaldolase n=1 Tax=Maribacter sp. X9 TaxID=3402159 RepID=UPI003AF36905
MARILLSSIIVLLVGCSASNKDSNSNTVLFAGEIVNPTSHQVVLYKGRQKIDSAQLDDKNRFKFTLPSIENGLYNFSHSPEFQYVYLEKGDSLMVRLNTIYFDESLVFSGSNEELNNFLLELFISAEEEDETMYSDYYELEPTEFTEKIKSLRNEKLHRLNELKTEVDMTTDGYELLKGSIEYTYNRYKEIYPFQHKRKTAEENFHDLPSDFYEYRNQLDYDNLNLTYLRPYYDFMKAHFGNLAYMTCKKGCDSLDMRSGKQLHFNKHKLHLIDSLVVDKELRDNLFRNVAVDYLLKKQDSPENAKIFLDDFKKVSKNNMHIEEIEHLYHGISNLQPSKAIPNFPVVSFDNDSTTLTEIAKNKKVLFYFWSGNNKKQYQDIFARVAELKLKKPDYDLVGINLKTDLNEWKVILKTLGADTRSQYHTDNFKELMETLVLDKMNKAIITDNALIVDGFSNIYYNN